MRTAYKRFGWLPEGPPVRVLMSPRTTSSNAVRSSYSASTSKSYDAIIVGLGAHGSACLYNLAKWGSKVLGLERFSISHIHGSHHGMTRITRQCYMEGPMYVPLLKKSFEMYEELERESKQKLFWKTGCLNIGEPVCGDALLTAKAHNLPYELLTGAEVNARFPGYELPPDTNTLFEKAGGILAPEKMVQAHCQVAGYHGADIHTNEQLLSWEATHDGGVVVHTDQGIYTADKLVLSPGAWLHKQVPELEGLCKPGRAVVAWLETDHPELYQPGNFPVFIYQNGRENVPYYGFPIMFDEPGVKLGAFKVSKECDPDTLNRQEFTAEDEALLREGLQQMAPKAAGRVFKYGVCMFVMTPDTHFIIDQHPNHPQVILCSACSGHGFKLSPAVGRVLADMVRHGSCEEFSKEMETHRLDPARPGHPAVLERFAAARGRIKVPI